EADTAGEGGLLMPEFHVAGWIDAFVDRLLLSYGALFDGNSAGILALLLRIQAGLEWLPWWAAVAITILAAYSLTRRPGLSLILGSLLVMVVAFGLDRKSTRLNSSHVKISYAVFCLKKKTIIHL